MSIFDEMWPRSTFDTMREYTELVRMLNEAISRGHVEELSTALSRKPRADEKWFREKESGVIYSLIEPDEKGPYWRPVEIEELMREGGTIQ
jgi:hypothetical protein